MMHNILMIEGEGIGPEISKNVEKIVAATGIKINWIKFDVADLDADSEGQVHNEEFIKLYNEYGLLVKGPTTTAVGVGRRSLNVGLRKAFKLSTNLRPILSIPGVNSKYTNLDMYIFRENTQGLYAGIEERDGDTSRATKLITMDASLNIAREAFEFALKNNRKKVTVAHKANILKLTDGLFLEATRAVKEDYPTIAYEEVIIDNMCMQLVMKPENYDVIVTMNLYGDILSDLCAGLIGGLGLTPSVNIGENHKMYEAVHGTAPDIVGTDSANPTALLLSTCMLLNDLGYNTESENIKTAIKSVFLKGDTLTKDLGGSASGSKFTEAVISEYLKLV